MAADVGTGRQAALRRSIAVRRFLLFGTLLLSLRGQDAAKLEHARTVNLERAVKLPSFVVDEKATRYKSPHTDPPKWEVFDTIESEIAVRGQGFRVP